MMPSAHRCVSCITQKKQHPGSCLAYLTGGGHAREQPAAHEGAAAVLRGRLDTGAGRQPLCRDLVHAWQCKTQLKACQTRWGSCLTASCYPCMV